MNMTERPQIKDLLDRLEDPSRHLILVSGPRQVGKTTLVRQALAKLDRPHRYVPVEKRSAAAVREPVIVEDDSLAFAPDSEPDAQWLASVWEQARDDARASGSEFILALDEIQKIPNWSEIVKGLWDEDQWHGHPLRVILLGSSPLLVQHGMSESLMGRFANVDLTHWTFEEMSAAFGFSLDQYIYYGGYPGAVVYHAEWRKWRDYINRAIIWASIDRDIMAMANIKHPALLKNLFDCATDYSGQEMAYNKIQGQLQHEGNLATLVHYLELLAGAGMVVGLEKHTHQSVQRKMSSPKLNVLNTAFMTARSRYSPEGAKANGAFWGRVVESAIGAHLYNTSPFGTEPRYWRNNGDEVDFVLQCGGYPLGIEVKSGARIRKAGGLHAFKQRFPKARTMVVGPAGDVSLAEFLSTPARQWCD